MSKVKIILIIIIIAALGSVFYWLGSDKKIMVAPADEARKARVIQEKLTIPDTTSFTGAEGRVVEQGSVAVALVPKSDTERVIVPGAELSVKRAYDFAQPAASKWSSDAKWVYINILSSSALEVTVTALVISVSLFIIICRGYEIII